MRIYSFEKLEVWVDSKSFTKDVYILTSSFPESEKFGLISQLRRASISICSNLAEGSARATFKDKAHFTNMAFGSAIEVLNQLIISYELGFISEMNYHKSRESLEAITNRLNGLRKYQLSQVNK
jgi:four helix bundle protein